MIWLKKSCNRIIFQIIEKFGKKYGGGLWDADHELPVVKGGGMCGLENIRTLCIKCHKQITAELLKK